ncbi:hypothetical protein HOD29_05055 [archaeon]|nr:hypothetical protein [archaeon]
MEINPELNFFKDKNSETFQEFLSKNSKFEFNYLLKIRFSNLQEEIIFKVISCDFGPDFGNPSQVFLNFKVGDKILVRISNGYKISESGRVFRYEGTTHLDKGAVHEANPHPTPYQIKGAGAFRKIIN